MSNDGRGYQTQHNSFLECDALRVVGVEEAIKPNNTMEMDAYLFSMSGFIGLSIGRCHMLKNKTSLIAIMYV